MIMKQNPRETIGEFCKRIHNAVRFNRIVLFFIVLSQAVIEIIELINSL
jgi:hypothetical protein